MTISQTRLDQGAPMTETNSHESRRQARGATGVLGDILVDLKSGACVGGANADNAVSEAKLGDVLDRLDERAFGFLLLLLALPCCLPFVYLLPQIVALPMLAIGAQMAMGRAHPWFPKKFQARTFSISAFETVLARAEKYIGWIEKIARPRLMAITSHVGGRIIGALLLIPIASILVPLPSTNTVPGIGVAIASLGLIERDGVLVLAGLVLGLAWVVLLGFLGLEAASVVKAWVSGLV